MIPNSSFVNAMAVGGCYLWRGKALCRLCYMKNGTASIKEKPDVGCNLWKGKVIRSLFSVNTNFFSLVAVIFPARGLDRNTLN
jgi:hypothetical protein